MKKLIYDIIEVGKDIKSIAITIFCEIVADIWDYGLTIGELTAKAVSRVKAKIDFVRSIRGIGFIREVR